MHITIESDAQVMQSLNSAPGYNLPTAVEAESHLIVAHEGCVDANDQRQIQPMTQAASDVLLAPCTADAGYANSTDHRTASPGHTVLCAGQAHDQQPNWRAPNNLEMTASERVPAIPRRTLIFQKGLAK